MKILLVDDNVSLTTLLSRALTNLGYEMFSENKSSNAIDTILGVNPDLVILDLNMPGKSGLEVFGELKLTPDCSNIPVIMLGALAKNGISTPETFGCDVITKPARLDQLKTLIEKNLGRDKFTPSIATPQKQEVYENILQ